MMTTIGNAVAEQDNSPAALVRKYEDDLTSTLPSHIDGKQWMSVALGALRRDPNVAQAAANNVGSFLSAMLTAARLGLEPGTEQYYLTPRKVKGRLEILGIVGYQGLIELIYRAGAVSSVIAEVVYDGDRFEYQPGRDDRPHHTIDWDAEDRGKLRLVYAYATMKDGATSKVVVLNRADISRIKQSSQGAGSEYSPWVRHEAAMWLKSAVRQLAKWVPTSAEYRREQLRAVQEVVAEQRGESRIAPVQAGDGEHIDTVTGEIMTDRPEPDEPVDAELVDPNPDQDTADWPPTAHPGGAA